MRRSVAAAMLLLLCLASNPASVAADFYLLPVGQGWIEGISDNGVAAGATGFGTEYFVWTPATGPQQIGGVTPGNGVGGQGKISRDGLYVCGTTYNAAGGYHELSRYDVAAGTWSGLGGIGGQSGTEISSGWAVSGDGLSVVGLGWISAGTAHAVRWSDGEGMVDLGSTVPGESTRANGVDEDGNVIVGWQDGAARQGAVWVDGVQELIFETGGSPALEAFSVSGDGRWVTGYDVGSFVVPGNLWRYDTVTDTYELLPNLPVGAERNTAGTSITLDGKTIVGGSWPLGPATFGTALIWRDGTGTTSMADYLDSVGVSYPDGFQFAFATAISSDGRWIAGWGNVGGPANTQSWVVQLSGPGEVPELTVDKSVDAPGALLLSWLPSCLEAQDYGIYEGEIGDWYSHQRIDCADGGGDLQEMINPLPGDRYYLVVPKTGTEEGGYGADSTGAQRPRGISACAGNQIVGPCP